MCLSLWFRVWLGLWVCCILWFRLCFHVCFRIVGVVLRGAIGLLLYCWGLIVWFRVSGYGSYWLFVVVVNSVVLFVTHLLYL